ncbi:hypothetical protein [Hydrogenophaga sp.]|uniref:hypothetical protein n=1 Tax=Hydrogenophaga sp. TaxID=1904254 RepID=UPI0025C077D6|nr:hypothetical protein [Hydrogenophaga sp.]
MKDLRRTGRTTRMLIDAVSCAREGKAVYVIAANRQEQGRLQRLLWELTDDQLCHGIKVETPSSVGLDWNSFTLIGAHPNCVVLVDHFTIERLFATQLHELHRYD